MNRFFDIDGPFITGLTKVADVFILNLLVIICSIPIFTIGAAWTALYYVTLKMVKDEDTYIVKSYFKSFKLNFKQATAIWLIFLFAGIVLYYDVRIMNGDFSQLITVTDGITKIMSIVLMAAGIIYTFTFVFVFPVLCRFDNSVKNTIKNAFFMSVRHFPKTIAIILITFIPLIFIYLVPRALILLFVVFGIIAYCNSFFFVKIFEQYMPKENITSDENFEIITDSDDN